LFVPLSFFRLAIVVRLHVYDYPFGIFAIEWKRLEQHRFAVFFCTVWHCEIHVSKARTIKFHIVSHNVIVYLCSPRVWYITDSKPRWVKSNPIKLIFEAFRLNAKYMIHCYYYNCYQLPLFEHAVFSLTCIKYHSQSKEVFMYSNYKGKVV
jgi:hypothetical protein